MIIFCKAIRRDKLNEKQAVIGLTSNVTISFYVNEEGQKRLSHMLTDSFEIVGGDRIREVLGE